ncbi:DUF3817 domain-containing protein [Halarcobacter ebronensis]|uniref:DUF3817 domain-containing protein n=1 Tax=Halarcobacter ebronensis TaxID=1462615 RepID=A0A4Q1ANG1_9BACT|nr:DUF3817 domain-containing protein [Halarcobacter ebronensis]QKF81642.1 DUF3817 domain-containing membrane protein [Halarcobacter ebronensis]RXK05566.1 hypothetical protein CRV07_08645 [Halarcobacter ebronensis]
MFNDSVNRFRIISAIEGISFLLLIFIAMPIKYIGENPYPVKIFGMVHGILFIFFMLSLFQTKINKNWNKGFMFQLFVFSLLPFGALLIEKRVKAQRD